MPDSPKDAKGIFLAAVDIADAAERAAFVERSCGGDAALRQRVDDLLRAYGQSGGPLEKLAAALATTEMAEPLGERVGDVVAGKYKLVEALGEGGMGAVFMAQQTQPVKRVVALKLIKLGMDSKQVLARFEAERQALALMDHPNIAKVLDAGTTDSGRPFFVMELVKGVPITRFCDERQLSPRQRLELFIPVCQAIQHAHQKGIIHRDIKPTNVLVALYDDRPVPKVIDFGVAKAAGLQLTDASLVTGFGAIVGTPEYMSPEQAQLNQLDIDTRSDVYALGVLLYELLTGTTPIDRKRLGQGALFEVLRIIREEEPPRPSTRLSTSDALASIAATRATEPSKLAKLMRGELDWIVMKCLEKDRSRRYETANGLAHDLERYLADEPVEACPPSSTYRLRKLAGKYKKTLATAAAFVVLLAAAAVASTLLAVWATSAEREANRQRIASDEAKQDALHAKQSAVDAKAEADRQRDEARTTAYASGMQLAQRAWEENRVIRTRELLEEVPRYAAGRKLRGFEWYYLSRLCHPDSRTIDNHGVGVTCVAFSADGRRLALGGSDKTVRIWDCGTVKEILALNCETAPVMSVALSPDGRRVALASAFCADIWDIETGKKHPLKLNAVCFFCSLVFSPDGRRLASGGGLGGLGQTVKIWDSATGKQLLSLEGGADSVRNVAFSPDGKRIASGSNDKTVKIWDGTTGKQLLSLKGHVDFVTSVAFSPDGRRLASGSSDKTVKIWDIATGKALFALKSDDYAAGDDYLPEGNTLVSNVAFSADAELLASSSGRTVKIWDSATGEELASLKGHNGLVTSVAFSPDGQRLASGSADGAKIWDSWTGKEPFSLNDHDGVGVSSVAFSPDGQRLASGSSRVKIWDAETGNKLLTLKGHSSVAFSPDGHRVASGGWDKTVKIWESATGKELSSLNNGAQSAMIVALSPDGQRLASGSYDKTVKIWDIANGQELLSLKGHGSWVMSVTFSPDGGRVASGGYDNTVRIWDSVTGKQLFVLKGHDAPVCSVAFSPDGHRLASGSYDKTVKIWDTRGARELLSLKGHGGVVHSVAFGPDGQRLASGSSDETVKIWDSGTGKELLSLKAPGGGINSVAFSPVGERLAAGTVSGSIHLWETMNVSSEIRQHRATVRTVTDLFSRLTLRSDVLERLQTLPGMSPSRRQYAIAIAREYPEDPQTLANLAWELLKLPHSEMSGYRKALRFSEEACQLEPSNGLSLRTLGMAYYRVGNYQKALATLVRSDQINKAELQESLPSNLAFLAMTQQQLGNAKEAQTELKRLRERLEHPPYEEYGFLREAESLLAKPKTPAGKQSAVAKP